MSNVTDGLLSKSIEARNHLSAALAQSIESDDQIIMQHVGVPHVLLGGRLEWLSAQANHLLAAQTAEDEKQTRDEWMQYERDTR